MSDWHNKNYKFVPDVDAYFKRINYSGSRELCYETLKAIQWNHLLTIAFEDLDAHLINYIDLNPPQLEQKIVFSRRGGYCFEQNILLYHILLALGFEVMPLLSRSRWQKPLDVVSPMTHIILLVTINNIRYIFDVGYSNFGTPYPLLLDTEEEQLTILEPRRITHTGDYYIQQLYVNNAWQDLYIFTLIESHPIDWEVGSYYIFSHPTSPLKLNLVVSIVTVDTRYVVINNALKIYKLNQPVEVIPVTTYTQLVDIINNTFHIYFDPSLTIRCAGLKWD